MELQCKSKAELNGTNFWISHCTEQVGGQEVSAVCRAGSATNRISTVFTRRIGQLGFEVNLVSTH